MRCAIARRIAELPRAVIAVALLAHPLSLAAADTECPLVPSAELVSETLTGDPGTGRSQYASMTHDGRYVAFNSTDATLVPSDTNGWEDVFLHDRQTGTTTRISWAFDGGETDERSYTATITPDGAHLAFASQATNIIPGDTNGFQDLFVQDLSTGERELVSVAFDGSLANGHSQAIAMTPDARYIAFASRASNLVLDDPNQDLQDVFVRDRVLGITERIPAGIVAGPALQTTFSINITPDGRYVTFITSYATVPGDPDEIEHFQGYVHDRSTGVTERSTTTSDGLDNNAAAGTLGCFDMTISDDGRYVAFQCNGDNLVPYDSYGSDDVFVKDRLTGLTERISVTDQGAALSRSAYRGQISGDGRYVAMLSTAVEYGAPGVGTPPPMAIVLHDRLAGMTKPILIQEESPPFVGFAGGDVAITPEARYAAYGAPLNSSQGAPPKNLYFQDRGEHAPRVLGLDTTCGEETLTVTVQAVSPSVVVADYSEQRSVPQARPLGAEISALRLVARPERGDVFVRMGVRSLEQAKALDGLAEPAAVVYRLVFAIDGLDHRVVVERVNGGGELDVTMRLLACPGGACTELAVLEGGFGTSGEAIRCVIPRGLLPDGPADVTGITLTTSAVDANGDERVLDTIAVPDGVLPGNTVEIGVDRFDVPLEDVAFVSATREGCVFTATLGDVPAGPIRIWTRVCDAETCDVAWVDCTHVVSVAEGATDIAGRLGPGSPNPFRASSRLGFNLPRAETVRLEIFDAAGRLVRTLLDADRETGAHDVLWDGRSDAGTAVAPGVFFVRLSTADRRFVQRIVRVR